MATQNEDSVEVCEDAPEAGKKTTVRSLATVSTAASSGRAGAVRMPSVLLTVLMCLLNALGGADLQLLPCSMDALRRDLSLRAEHLALMISTQSLCGTIAGPTWAFLADQRILSRRKILIIGSVGQGLVTVALAFITWWVPMLLLRALNGVMLAALRPIIMGIIADLTSEECRGKVFGYMNLAEQVGQMVTSFTATPLSKQSILGVQGWRVVFVALGVGGVLIGVAIVQSMKLPELPKLPKAERQRCRMLAELRQLASLFTSPTFVVLIVQGLFGCMAMSAGSFATMYFQMVGVGDFQAGLLGTFSQAACAIGVVFGGYLGDWAAGVSRKHGRVLVAEVSLSMGIPLVFLKFWGVPGIVGSFGWYTVLTVTFGLLAVWVTAGAKQPLLSEIVPPDRVSAVMAWDATMEGSLSAAFGAPLVALLAKTMFGFTADDFSKEDLREGPDSHNARALGRASALMTCVPALLSLLCWPLLHIAYPRDLRRLEQEEQQRQLEAIDNPSSSSSESSLDSDSSETESE